MELVSMANSSEEITFLYWAETRARVIKIFLIAKVENKVPLAVLHSDTVKEKVSGLLGMSFFE